MLLDLFYGGDYQLSVTKMKSKILPEAEDRLRRLTPEHLIVANDFLAYLEDRENSEATLELMNLPGFEDAFQKALKQVERKEVINFKKIKRNV